MKTRKPFLLPLFFISLIFLGAGSAAAQAAAIGHWQDYLSYQQGVSVTIGNGKVYCSTKSGIFSYNLSDNSFSRLSKITGFSDVGASAIKFNPYNNTLLIAYNDANLDLVENNTIVNIPDIMRASILGNKKINDIYFDHQYAYLACGFGIVVVNTEKNEISDTYYIGPNGTNLKVNAITSNNNYLYAATDSGIYRVSFSDPNPANFNDWTKLSNGLPNGIYNAITSMEGKVYVNFSNILTTGTSMDDSVFAYDGNSWKYFPMQLTHTNIKKLSATTKYLVSVDQNDVSVFDSSGNRVSIQGNYYFGNATPEDGILDNNFDLWIADGHFGLIHQHGYNVEHLYPPGPRTTSVFDMAQADSGLWVVPGTIDASLNSGYNTDGTSSYIKGDWTSYGGSSQMDTLYDQINVAVDPNNGKHAFVGTWGEGLLEFNNGKLVNVYKETNSSLHPIDFPGFYNLRIGGEAFDADGNLWVANSESSYALSVMKTDGIWKALDFSSYISNDNYVGKVMVTQSDQKWVILPGTGIMVYQDNGTFAKPDASNTKMISDAVGSGNLPSRHVYSMAEDHDGAIWVGTDAGVAVFYNPDEIFSGNNDWDSQQILLNQDGYVQILLYTETVTAIAVDGANRKWFGTESGGVFLMSADGTKQIHHFDVDNSPLLDNDVTSIAIDHATGEVFIGTAKGIESYRSDATEGNDNFNNVYAFPNPVKHDYHGVIAIKGLVNDADVKITDTSGRLVYHTTANGGEAIWNGDNFDGKRVQTGVYLVFCSNNDGSKTYVTKILFIN